MAITNTQWEYTEVQRDFDEAKGRAAAAAAAGKTAEYRQFYSGTFNTLPSEYNKDSNPADVLVIKQYGIPAGSLRFILAAPDHPQHIIWRARIEAAHTYLGKRTYRGHTT